MSGLLNVRTLIEKAIVAVVFSTRIEIYLYNQAD